MHDPLDGSGCAKDGEGLRSARRRTLRSNADEATEPGARLTIDARKTHGEADSGPRADDRSLKGQGAAGQRDADLLQMRAFHRPRGAAVDIAAGRADAADAGLFLAALTQP